jgi:hypothetical protein
MKSKFLLFSLLLSATLLSCGKYDDGPGISFRSKTHRVAGNWEVSKWTVDGDDALMEYEKGSIDCWSGGTVNYVQSYGFDYLYFNFTSSGKSNFSGKYTIKLLDYSASMDNCEAIYDSMSGLFYGEGNWSFESSKEKLTIDVEEFSKEPMTYEIKELKEKEMKLEGTDEDGQLHVMTLKKR